ncbi:MAG: NADPH-dependent oxidoreductase [Methylococcales bacterium]|nr:NADPH-dependent oxidoreductase [Methylococcales bacterium]MDD5754275.1 NADPH-dependent oxidoreductase [Methylococcales bacterium]
MPHTLSDLLSERYGKNLAHLDFELNSTLETLLSHKSIRHYLDKPLPDGALELMIAAAQSAASSSNLQLWSVVAITNAERKQRLSELANNQSQITQAPLFLVWLADVSRLEKIMIKDNLDTQGLHQLDLFLIAIIDAALAAQNAVIAAEAQGYGTVYIGALRNNVARVSAELQLPNGVFPVFGLCVGYPNPEKKIGVKPRLSQESVLHKEVYQPNELAIDAYNDVMTTFYQQQKMNVEGTWAKHCSDRIQARATHSELQIFLENKFCKK